MNFKEIQTFLKQKGTAQNRKVYKRHGAQEPLYGVSFAHLNQLRKQLKVNQELALRLWNTGNMDCRTLALMIADPEQLTSGLAESWVKECNYKVLAGELAHLVSRSHLADKKMKSWMKARKEYVRKCGYDLVSCRLQQGWEADSSSIHFILNAIEAEIHSSKDQSKHAMVMALISIGIYCPKLETKVLATNKKIGPVHVDHGQTGCKTPDVESYILRAKERRQKKKK